ncbi:14073_t:CDS:2, partial [Funneliformis caledonium]
MSKRKASSEKNEKWNAINKQHTDWIGTLNDIWTNHPIARIQKLADKSIKNYKVMYLHLLYVITGFKRRWYRSWVHPMLWTRDKILCFPPLSESDISGKMETTVEHRNDLIPKSEYNELQDIQVEHRDNSYPKSEDNNQDELHTEGFNNDEEQYEEEYFAHIIDLDNATEREKPQFFTVEEWSKIISESQPPSIKLPKSVEEQLDLTLEEDIYTRKVMEHFIFCLENRPDYFAQRPCTESTFCVRFIGPIIEPFIFIFKNLDITWGEVSSLSSATRRNFRLEEGKRRRIGSKGDGIGSLVNLDNKEFLVIELSGAPTRLPKRHIEGDKVKIERCLVDILNNHLEDYKTCDFQLAKKLRVFGFQTE